MVLNLFTKGCNKLDNKNYDAYKAAALLKKNSHKETEEIEIFQ